MKYYLIAGEASGDLHGANLMRAVKRYDINAEFRFWGGDDMEKQASTPVKHYRDLAFMGFIEVVQNLRTILGNIRFCKEDILAYEPDVLVLIDYPGFNLRIAEFAKKQGFKVVYYISPQVWAWKAGRVKKIKRFVDEMLVILPFEKDFYARYNYEVKYVGHPLLDAIDNLPPSSEDFRKENGLDERKIIALLPGSRKQEIKKILPEMLAVVKDFPDYQFVIGGAPSKSLKDYEAFDLENVKIVFGKTYSLFSASHAALVTSGTATLEAALFGLPEVVCYKGSEVSYQIGKRLVTNIEYISLVNLIMDTEVVKELIQNDLNTQNLKLYLSEILEGEKREEILKDYALLKEKLGGGGASEKAATAILDFVK